MTRARHLCLVAAFTLLGAGCGSSGSVTQTGTGGAGASLTGGTSASGGATGTGGGTSPGTGGSTSAGGNSGTGGVTGTGGHQGTGGVTSTGGHQGTGGVTSTSGSGGATGAAGAVGSGGSKVTGAAGSGSGGSGSGGSGAGGMASAGGSSGGKPAPVPSAGCGTQGMQSLIANGQSVASGLPTSTRLTIASAGGQREYIIDIPSNYDATHPYRLFFAFHWIGSTDTAVATGQVSNGGATNWGFYGLHREATSANDPAMFVAPQALGGSWGQQDHQFFDDLYALVTSKLCVDTGRVFATGFSFGAMMTYSLSLNHQKQLRAVVALAAANYNIYDPPDTGEPIAYMGTVGMNDTTCPYVHSDASKQGGKYCALTHAMDNGCTILATIPTTTSGSKTHVCYDFQGCKAGYPVKMCTFDGVHQAAPFDGGSGDNGLTSWIPPTSWQFFTQF